MDQINIKDVEYFFANEGAEIYNIADTTVAEEGMTSYINSGVLIGFSGGADSVMLLCFLLEYRRRNSLDFNIVCAHINHGIRGAEADSDEQFSKDLCNGLGVDILVNSYRVPEIVRSSGLGLEEAARNIRYATFKDIISSRNDIRCIAVAHNMSDSVETVIFNMLRGCGTRGASGIRPVRDNIIRPLIRVPKNDIQAALSMANIPFVIDSTNLSTDYTRNFIRHEIIPSFGKVTSAPEKMIARFSDNLRSDEDFIDKCADDFLANHKVIRNVDLLAIHRSVLIRVLGKMAAINGASISNKIFSDIISNLSKDNFSYSLIGNASFFCERGECRIIGESAHEANYFFDIHMGVNDLYPFNAIFVLSEQKNDKIYSNVYKKSIQANISSAIINGSLYLRPRNDGDTIYYGGMTHKVKKLFSDAKIPRCRRKLIPILCDDRGVVWIPGFGVRDDGVAQEKRKDLYVTLAINTEDGNDGEDRLYSGSEFRT